MRTAAVLACALALAVPVAARATATPPRCAQFAASPSFAHDRTAFCLTWVRHPKTDTTSMLGPRFAWGTTDIGVYRTVDAGHTWRRIESDLPWDSNSAPGSLAFSATYATDHTVAVQIGDQGLYATTNGGAHFAPLDPLAQSARTDASFGGLVSSFAQTVGGQTVPSYAFFDWNIAVTEADPSAPAPVGHHGWNGNSALVPANGGHVPVMASPGASLAGFQLSQTFGRGGRGYVLAYHLDVNTMVNHSAIWLCDTTLNCSTPVHVFPARSGVQSLTLLDRTGQRLAAVVGETVGTDGVRWHVQRSTDGGVTWSTWAALEHVVQQFGDQAGDTWFALAADPAGTRVALRISRTTVDDAWGPSGAEPTAAPGEQVWVSDNSGASFRRTAYGPAGGQSGRGTLPWDSTYEHSPAALVVAPGGRLFAFAAKTKGAKVTSIGVYCSADGRTWRPTC